MANVDPEAFIHSLLQAGDTATARTAIGMGSVDDTTDPNKPISTATQAALDAITARQWVEVAANSLNNATVPSSYAAGVVHVMAVTSSIGYPTGVGKVTTDTRVFGDLAFKFQTFQDADTPEGPTYQRFEVFSSLWSDWGKVIQSIDGEILDQIQLPNQLLTDDDSAVTQGLGDARYATALSTEIVVTSIAQLTGVLDSTKVYSLDGFIATGSQTIAVPSGGLTIEGNGRGTSGLSSADAAYTMFTGSGTLNLCGLDIACTGAGSQILDLDNAEAGGFVTLVDCSVTNAIYIGELNDYAAALFSNVTIFNATEGVTFSGTWSSGIRIDTFVGISGVSGLTYFSEGTSLTFGSRFISNANLNIPTSGVGYNFSESNFDNDGQFELLSGDLSGAGTPVTGITRGNVKSKWRDNNGLANTYVGSRWVLTTETATVVGADTTYYKLAGTTTYADEQWFSNTTDNAFVYDSTNAIEVVISGTLSISAGNNNQIQIKVRMWDDSASAYVDIHEHGPITMSGAGAGENIAVLGFADMEINDRIEVWAQNLSSATNITMLEGTLISCTERAN
jgi:hypothetical protein